MGVVEEERALLIAEWIDRKSGADIPQRGFVGVCCWGFDGFVFAWDLEECGGFCLVGEVMAKLLACHC